MVNTYVDIRDENGLIMPNRTKLFIEKIDDLGNIIQFSSGIVVSPNTPGTLFIVDSYIIDQIEKIKFVDNNLVVKEGEKIEVPKKTAEELEREQLLKRLAELESKIEKAPIVE